MRTKKIHSPWHSLRAVLLFVALASAPMWQAGPGLSADDWPPVSPEELRMTAEPDAPGAPAIYLYRQVDRDDNAAQEINFARIKILTEEGRKYADVEIQFIQGREDITGLRARLVRPDGSVANFDGKIYEKTVVKARGFSFVAKTFTIPDVQVGSIIDYRYMSHWNAEWIYDSRWVLSEELFTKHAKFSLLKYLPFALTWSLPKGLPPGTSPPVQESQHRLHLETRNVPAVAIEDFMPPELEVMYRVDFVYSENDPEKDQTKFWALEGKKRFGKVEEFAGKRKAMEQAVAEVVSPGDSPEVKLKKIYARCQQIRNLSYEPQKTAQEKAREKQKEIKSVEEVWKLGYGYGTGITWLFLGMARAAGLDAYPVLISPRSQYFFNPTAKNANQLNEPVVLVKLAGKDLFFDPGTRFAPYGLLPWYETGVTGLQLTKDGGVWVTIPLPESSTSRVERKANFKLDEQGTLEGDLTVTYAGQEALTRRQRQREADATARKESLENEVKAWVPVGIDVDLKKQPDWESSTDSMQAEFKLTVKGWATGTGRRSIVPVGLFSARDKHLFEHAKRVHPIYFSYPGEDVDDIAIQIPVHWLPGSLPREQDLDLNALAYQSSATSTAGILRIRRLLNYNMMLSEAKNYATIQSFFQTVKAGDEEQIVLQIVQGTAGN